MPNRKTFDPRERYDHSSHSTANRESGDVAPTPDSTTDAPQRSPRKSTRAPRSTKTQAPDHRD
jgi:hypothetical protein